MWLMRVSVVLEYSFFFQAEDGIRDLVRSRGLGDVYKRQPVAHAGEEMLDAGEVDKAAQGLFAGYAEEQVVGLSLIHI